MLRQALRPRSAENLRGPEVSPGNSSSQKPEITHYTCINLHKPSAMPIAGIWTQATSFYTTHPGGGFPPHGATCELPVWYGLVGISSEYCLSLIRRKVRNNFQTNIFSRTHSPIRKWERTRYGACAGSKPSAHSSCAVQLIVCVYSSLPPTLVARYTAPDVTFCASKVNRARGEGKKFLWS